jgi:hypothetical protein
MDACPIIRRKEFTAMGCEYAAMGCEFTAMGWK